jgi:hypothetical protein
MHPRIKVDHTDVSASPQVTTEISHAVQSFKTSQKMKDKIDTFEVALSERDIPAGVTFDAEDDIKIYIGSADNPADLAFNGIVKDLQYDININEKTYTLKGQSRIESLLSSQTPMNEISKTADHIGSRLIEFANSYNAGNPNWTNLVWSGDGALTQTNNFQKQEAPIFQHLEETSSNEYTGNGQYIYYLANDGSTVIWRAQPTSTTGSLVEGVDIRLVSAGKSEYDVVNYAVVDGGLDFNGNPIRKPVYNATSIGKLGRKQKYYTDDNLSKYAKYISGCSATVGSPFGDPTNWTGGNANLRNYVGSLIKYKWQPIVNALGLPRWKVKVDHRGTLKFGKGDLWDLQMPSAGWGVGNEKKLQLTGINQNFNKKDWVTSLQLEQTAEAAVEELI